VYYFPKHSFELFLEQKSVVLSFFFFIGTTFYVLKILFKLINVVTNTLMFG